ncbi:MAG: SusD/RagB family nutrient-binding outer membrane lipoprotein [Flavobacteriaceae bacterium]|nr:MAG: SusD/RagB family nutrient-binding outer membrane lipoprotein [Flavobacteriaceae bacterium]
MKNIFKIGLSLMLVFIVGCDKDEFAELNSNPSAIAKPSLSYSVATAVEQMYKEDYTTWFYNKFKYEFPWGQLTGSGTGNSEGFVTMGATGTQSNNFYLGVFPNTRDVRAQIDNLPADQQEKYQAIRSLTFAIQIQTAMTITDDYGSMVYSEAALAAYTTPALITPKFDTQEELFTIWLGELDEAIIGLSKEGQVDLVGQDLIYGGDYAKWAKFCNLLKLKIAARLVNADRAKAIAIAEEVANSDAGYMTSLSDDFIYHRGIKYYGTGNGTQPGGAGKNVIDFLIGNKDPRVRFLFTKNSFNGEIVQGFIDNDKALPPYVAANVVLDADGDFEGWAGAGEPWVRYYGAPLSPDAQFDDVYDAYFKQSELNQLMIGSNEKRYSSTSRYSERITRTKMNVTYPTLPGGRILELKDIYPAMKVVLGSSAETNLYLAEFSLLGATLPSSAQEFLNEGVRLSVERMNDLAKNNGDPYYEGDPVYEDDVMEAAGATKLRSGEIDALLAQPALNLATDGLEKVYIQQYLNFAATPGDFFTTVRRSGIPKTGSAILPREAFMSGGFELTVPRRFSIGTPTADYKNYANQKAAIDAQGFTTGTNDPEILNAERLWFDMNNPVFGAGPKN